MVIHGTRDSRVTGKQPCAHVRAAGSAGTPWLSRGPALAGKKIFLALPGAAIEPFSTLEKQRKNNPLICPTLVL